MTAAASLLYRIYVHDIPGPPADISLSPIVLGVAFFVCEYFVIHLQFRGDSHAMTLAEIPLLLGLFFVDPGALILACIVGSTLAWAIPRRQWWVKVAFNASKSLLEVVAALAVFNAMHAFPHGANPETWPAAFAAMLSTDLMAGVLVTLAIVVHEGSPGNNRLLPSLWIPAVTAGANTCMGLVVAGILWHEPLMMVPLAGLGAVMYGGYRGYASLRQRYANLKGLYRFTSAVGSYSAVADVVSSVLAEARDLLTASRAEITLLTDEAKRTTVRFLLEDGDVRREPAPGPEHDIVLRRVMAGELVLIPETTRDPSERLFLEGRGFNDYAAVPLRSDAGVIGALAIGGRMGNVRSFDDEDLKLFATLANHASVSLSGARLMEQLRQEAVDKEYQAQHDALTGLPNRATFLARLASAISGPSDATVAVLLLDLDGFKEINHTLGHATGDTLLKHLAVRLRRLAPEGALISRLGGDEFAISAEVTDGDHARAMARTILDGIAEPFFLDNMALGVGGSVGIALHPGHGAEARVLLQQADVAMYMAKRSGGGIETYDPDRDYRSPRRLSLVGDLRQAIERSEISVHYQPKVDLATGRVTGVEALARWSHPRFGFVPPDEFIPVAEHTGLVRPLTQLVLQAALTQCRTWNDVGHPFGVAVNLSTRSLLDLDLPDDVARALQVAGVPAVLLTLEITETAMMADPARCKAALERLSAMGVQISVDDFGTGYSSLSYLTRLPVDEVKIDKSFVMEMMRSKGAASIVRSIIDLGENLGLRVVAEGIEDELSWERLRSMGCSVAQGYWLARPQPAADLDRWLETRDASRHAIVAG